MSYLLKRFSLIVSMFILFEANTCGQTLHVEVTPHFSDYGETNHDLTGFCTYKFFIEFPENGYRLLGLLAPENPANFCDGESDSAMFVNTTTGFFQHENGSHVSVSQPCELAGSPTLFWDSYFTIGSECANPPITNCDNLVFPQSNLCDSWIEVFENDNTNSDLTDGGSVFWESYNLVVENSVDFATCIANGGVSYSTTSNENLNRILIGQFTTDGNISANFNFAYSNPANEIQTIFGLSYTQCKFPLDSIPEALCEPTSFGNNELFSLENTTNSAVEYRLFAANSTTFLDDDQLIETSSVLGQYNSIPLAPGNYYAISTDETGCSDTSQILTLDGPPVYTMDTTRVAALCSSDTNFMYFEYPADHNPEEYFSFYLLNTQFDAIASNDVGMDTLVSSPTGFIVESDSNLSLLLIIEDSAFCRSSFGPINLIIPDEFDMSLDLDTGFCPGELNQISLMASPGNSISYTLFSRDTVNQNSPDVLILDTLQQNPGEIMNISVSPGSYILYAANPVGCIDTSEVFGFPTNNFSVTVIASAASICPDTAIGSVIINCAGGNGTISVSMNDSTSWNGQSIGCSQVISGLECGNYFVQANDNFGCVVDTTVTIPCFEPIAMSADLLDDELCFLGYTGSIIVNCEGADQGLNTFFNGNPITCDTIIDSLTCGEYVVRAIDQNGCNLYDTVNVSCPEIQYDFTQSLDFNGTPICVNSNNGDTLFFNPNSPTVNLVRIDGVNSSLPVALPIDCGDHLIEVFQIGGCKRDTIIHVPCIDEPALTLTLQYGVYCYGDSTAVISMQCNESEFDSITLNNEPILCGDFRHNLPCGLYDIVGYYAGTCSLNQQVEVECPSTILYNLNHTDLNCYGDDNGTITGTISGGNGRFYSEWLNDGDFMLNITGQNSILVDLDSLNGAEYVVFLLDSVSTLSGADSVCITSDTITILEPPLYSFTSSIVNASCFQNCDGTATYEVTGGTPFNNLQQYNFIVEDTAGIAADTINLCANQYVVTISDANGCILIDSIEITEPDSFAYSLTSSRVSCFGICDAVIEVTGVTGPYGELTYELDPSSGDCGDCSGNQTQFLDLCADDYILLIRDSSCVQSIPLTIQTPALLNLNISSSNITCFELNNGEISLNYSGGTSPVIIQGTLDTLPISFSDLSAQWYHYNIIDTSGCTDVDSVLITQPALLEIDTQAVNGVSCGIICDGSLSYVPQGGTPPYNYLLIPDSLQGSTNGFIPDMCAGDYTIYLTDIQNCIDSVNFTIGAPIPLSINAILDQPTCTGMFDGSIQLLPNGGVPPIELNLLNLNYELFPVDSATYGINNLGEDSLFFELLDAVNCPHTDTIAVIPDIITDMVLNMFSSRETCWGEMNGTATVAVINGNKPIAYYWDDPNNQTTPTAVGLGSNQEYTVTVTDNIGCTLKGSVFVDNSDSCLVITNALTPNGDGINDIWILGGLEFFTEAEVFVHNRWGQLVFYSKGYSDPWDGTFNGKALPIGDYYFSIEYAKNKEKITGTVTIKY